MTPIGVTRNERVKSVARVRLFPRHRVPRHAVMMHYTRTCSNKRSVNCMDELLNRTWLRYSSDPICLSIYVFPQDLYSCG